MIRRLKLGLFLHLAKKRPINGLSLHQNPLNFRQHFPPQFFPFPAGIGQYAEQTPQSHSRGTDFPPSFCRHHQIEFPAVKSRGDAQNSRPCETHCSRHTGRFIDLTEIGENLDLFIDPTNGRFSRDFADSEEKRLQHGGQCGVAARCARGAIGAKFGGLLEVEGDLADREGFFLGSSRQEEESEGK